MHTSMADLSKYLNFLNVPIFNVLSVGSVFVRAFPLKSGEGGGVFVVEKVEDFKIHKEPC